MTENRTRISIGYREPLPEEMEKGVIYVQKGKVHGEFYGEAVSSEKFSYLSYLPNGSQIHPLDRFTDSNKTRSKSVDEFVLMLADENGVEFQDIGARFGEDLREFPGVVSNVKRAVDILYAQRLAENKK